MIFIHFATVTPNCDILETMYLFVTSQIFAEFIVGPTRPIWVPRKHSDMSLKKISWTKYAPSVYFNALFYHTHLSYFTTDPPLPFDVAFNIIEGGRVTEQILAHRFSMMP